MILGIDAPERTRASVAFKDGAHGLLITADKARHDAALLRVAADLLKLAQFGAGATRANAERAAGALRSLAEQFEMAADGRDPQAS